MTGMADAPVGGAVTVRFWAAARSAAGTAEQMVPGAFTLEDLLAWLSAAHGRELAAVLPRCSFLVDEVSPGTRPHSEVVLSPGTVVDVLPPFAGGSGTGHPAPGLGPS